MEIFMIGGLCLLAAVILEWQRSATRRTQKIRVETHERKNS